MKRAPRSLQHHVLYRKYNGQDSEISALLGKCGLIQCRRELGSASDLTLMAVALLEEVNLEGGDRPADLSFLSSAFEQLGHRDSWFDPLASLVVSRMRIALIDGADADSILRHTESVANRRNYRRLLRLVDLLRIEMLLRTEQENEAARLIEFLRDAPWSKSELDPVNLRGAPIATLEARLALVRGEPEAALNKLNAQLSGLEIARNTPRSIRLSLLKVRALLMLDEQAPARGELERLALSQRVDQYCLPFVEEGKGLAQFLNALVLDIEPTSIVFRRLAPCVALIGRHIPEMAFPEIARLTPSESEVLVRLERGLANKEIARSLQITDNTVKYHLANIFRKLDVTTRTAAITRARTSGLLAAIRQRANLSSISG
ncbi:LuxR C-terminal-related transcriptional regulator [Paracoccus sp. TOH]|uniref:LuxR C-terminal-related transcriptional regulator n=1 Tax=Paracoccus sp. TOH TaxID=1263728 RepID=UPI0025B0C349|nr:LuxR C-terminal-related transcriptional regulator [Paracoccus sp. TOH]WJS87311.1 LuxR C-terminal-related transcriptional regulator [Paracoccus sp. TOH]